jgi:hypothetical protein
MTRGRGHALVVGGSGMLAGLSRRLAANGWDGAGASNDTRREIMIVWSAPIRRAQSAPSTCVPPRMPTCQESPD